MVLKVEKSGTPAGPEDDAGELEPIALGEEEKVASSARIVGVPSAQDTIVA